MECSKVGSLIKKLRKEKGMTQLALAERMNISDKTVSKWERAMGCPDVDLLPELSHIFGVNIEELLSGELNTNDRDGGNMNKVKFYSCPECGNVMTATGDASISCCGRKLQPMQPKAADGAHQATVETVEDDYFVTLTHPMTKEHSISFVAFTTYDRILFIKLYPEQGAHVRFPKMNRGKLFIGCNHDGLFEQRV